MQKLWCCMFKDEELIPISLRGTKKGSIKVVKKIFGIPWRKIKYLGVKCCKVSVILREDLQQTIMEESFLRGQEED